MEEGVYGCPVSWSHFWESGSCVVSLVGLGVVPLVFAAVLVVVYVWGGYRGNVGKYQGHQHKYEQVGNGEHEDLRQPLLAPSERRPQAHARTHNRTHAPTLKITRSHSGGRYPPGLNGIRKGTSMCVDDEVCGRDSAVGDVYVEATGSYVAIRDDDESGSQSGSDSVSGSESDGEGEGGSSVAGGGGAGEEREKVTGGGGACGVTDARTYHHAHHLQHRRESGSPTATHSSPDHHSLLHPEPGGEGEDGGGYTHLHEAGGKGGDSGLVIKSYGVLWTRELLAILHIGYQIFMCVSQSGNHGTGGMWWPHSMLTRCCVVVAWALILPVEEALHRDLRVRRLPWPVALWYVVSGAASAALIGLRTLKPHTVEFWDCVVVCAVVVPVVLWSAVVPVHTRAVDAEELTPDENAGVVTSIFFSWMDEIITKCIDSQRIDTQKDVPPLHRDMHAEQASERLLELLHRYPHDSLFANVLRLAATRYWQQMAARALSSLSLFAAPLALRQLVIQVHQFHGGSVSLSMWRNVAIMLIGPLLNAVGDTATFSLGRTMGCQCRAALSSLVMRKALRLDVLNEGGVSAGELTNLLAVDAQSLVDYMVFSHMILGGVEVLIITVVLLYDCLGLSSLVGLLLVMITVPANWVVQKKMKALQRKIMDRKDVRMSGISEALYAIRVIKLFAYEPNFEKGIGNQREHELNALRGYVWLLAVTTVVLRGTPTLVALLTFVFHTKVLNKPLDASAGFTSLALFNLLRFPLMGLPDAMSYVNTTIVSMKRIERFLQRREVPGRRRARSQVNHTPQALLQQPSLQLCVSEEEGRPMTARIEGGTYGYGLGEDATAVLRDIWLSIPKGGLTVVYGATGSGKTSLLMAMLGEILTLQGTCEVYTRNISYVSQRAWIQNMTLRENVLMGKRMEWQRYARVLHVCALGPDLQDLSHGDLAEIGEKGVNLSGGQCQRVNLARALYADAQLVLMDDVLSAVDAPVAEHIYHKAVCNFLRGTTRVLVTHQAALTMAHADHVVVLSEGAVLYSGPPNQAVLESLQVAPQGGSGGEEGEGGERVGGGGCNRSSSGSYGEGGRSSDSSDENLSGGGSGGPGTGSEKHAGGSTAITGAGDRPTHVMNGPQEKGSTDSTSPASTCTSSSSTAAHEGATPPTPPPLQLLPPPQQQTSSSSLSSSQLHPAIQKLLGHHTLRHHHHHKHNKAVDKVQQRHKTPEGGKGEGKTGYSAGSLSAYLLYFTSAGPHVLASTLIFSIGAAVLTVLQSLYLGRWVRVMEDTHSISGPRVDTRMWLFVAACVGSLLCLFLRAVFGESATIAASRRLHERLVHRVLHAPTQWFDATPMGRIFNRFSHDFQIIDKEMMTNVIKFLDMLLSLLGVTAITCIVLPQMIFAMVPVLIVSVWVSRRYLLASRQLKSLEAAARSPVFAHFQEAVTGIITVRAYGAPKLFLDRLHMDVDESNRLHWYLWMANYWLAMRLRLLGATVSGVTAMAVVLRAGHGVDDTAAGLALTYALPFAQAVVFTIRCHAEIEMSLNSVDRVREYLFIPQELPAVNKNHRPPQRWPLQGEVDVSGLLVRYRRELDPVLHGISFHVPPRTKVGIVGRTGSGKSTLMNSIFRLVEPEAGQLLVDGVNVLSLGLADLRQGLAAIPQEPTLFKGTVRSNLDMFGRYTDDDLWAALRQVRLDGAVSRLEQEVSEGGTNLSVGERQLLCFARALLKKSAVVVMDEATANVDPQTDAAIQETIRTRMGGTTVLCIAHRLHTVMYYDRVLVLDQGTVLEYDVPLTLLLKEDSKLRSMAERTGDLDGLIAIARDAAGDQAPAE